MTWYNWQGPIIRISDVVQYCEWHQSITVWSNQTGIPTSDFFTENKSKYYWFKYRLTAYHGGRLEQSPFKIWERTLYRVRAQLSRQRFIAIPNKTTHFFSSIYTCCTPWKPHYTGRHWIVLRYRRGYVSGSLSWSTVHSINLSMLPTILNLTTCMYYT